MKVAEMEQSVRIHTPAQSPKASERDRILHRTKRITVLHLRRSHIPSCRAWAQRHWRSQFDHSWSKLFVVGFGVRYCVSMADLKKICSEFCFAEKVFHDGACRRCTKSCLVDPDRADGPLMFRVFFECHNVSTGKRHDITTRNIFFILRDMYIRYILVN